MKNSMTQSMQPLLAEVNNYSRFAGRYYLSILKEGITRTANQRYLKLLISDASADIEVYCCAPELLRAEVQQGRWIHIEASLCQARGTAYFRCKNLVANDQITTSGLDMTALPRSVCPSRYAFDALFIIVNHIKNRALRDFVRSVILQPDVCANFLCCPAIFDHQYNYPGGLLEKAIEMALSMSDVTDISDSERDIAIVVALLRDLDTIQKTSEGSLKDFQSSSFRSSAQMCNRQLDQLAKEAPDTAKQLKHSLALEAQSSLSKRAIMKQRSGSKCDYIVAAA